MYIPRKRMKFLLITSNQGMVEEAKQGFHPSDELVTTENWREGLDQADGVDLMFIDMLATLTEPHKIAGYEEFAYAKMEHPKAKGVPLVLISPPENYELDFLVGFPDFLMGNLQSPVDYRNFRRASTWV